LPTVIALLGLASLATGICFLVLGLFGLGKLVRIIPYPVIGGFLAGTGWLIVEGSMGVMAGVPLRLDTLSALFQGDLLARWGPSVLYAGALLAAARRFRSYLTIPALLVAATGVFYLGLWLAGASIAQASTQGWLLGPMPGHGLPGKSLSHWRSSSSVRCLCSSMRQVSNWPPHHQQPAHACARTLA
jgi:SulP family sulfate permease